jgi:hypothetical protein
MVSVIGLDAEKVQMLCDAANEEVNDENRVQIANYLCTVSGTNFLVANMSYWRANIQCSEQGTIQSCLANTLVNPESE